MHFFPILSTLGRHRTAATLIVLEIAFTCAIVCNAIFLIGDRITRMDRSSGIVEEELLRVRLTGIGKREDAAAVTEQDMTALRAIPGVKSVAVTNMIPFGSSSWNTTISTIPEDPDSPVSAGMYIGTQDLVETMGLQVIAGRDFTPEEYVELDAADSNKVTVASVIITRAIAEKLFPGKNAVGQALYVTGKEPQRIVGVVEHLARANEGGGDPKARPEYSLLLPIKYVFSRGGNYLIRVDPTRRAEVLAAVDATLDKVDSNRIKINRQEYAEVRREYFKQDRAMAWLLVGVSIALLIITALGIVGLASFWVQQRTRQIGVRRALGATRRDILRYFQTENFILATMGIILGMLVAYAVNLWLMDTYQVPRLPAIYLPIGALLLWGLGQIAVFGPALRASAIPPAIATRTV